MLVGIVGKGLEVAVEADWVGRGGDLPLGGAEDDADVSGIKLQEAGRNGAGFYGLVDGCEDNDVVAGDLNDDAAAGEAGDDFVLALSSLGGGGRGQKRCGEEGGEKGEALHGRVQLITVTGVKGSMGGRGEYRKRGDFGTVLSGSADRQVSEDKGYMGLKKAKSITHKGKKLTEILEEHERFFRGHDGGVRADLAGAELSGADLSGANLSGAILREANLAGSDLRKTKLPGADLSGARMHKVDLRNSDLTEAILPGADLSEAQASGIEFFRCDLSGVNFEKAILRNANFRLANIRGAKFAGADMGVAILRETDLEGVDLSGVDLATTLMPKGYAGAKVKGA